MAKRRSIYKQGILANYGFLVVDHSAKHCYFVKDEKEVQRMLENGDIGDSDVILSVSEENMRVAEKRDYIELV